MAIVNNKISPTPQYPRSSAASLGQNKERDADAKKYKKFLGWQVNRIITFLMINIINLLI